MRTLSRIIAGTAIFLILVLLVVRVVGFNPKGPRAGLWLSGNVVKAPVPDWSFTDSQPTIQLQTNTWYLIPHSVTIWCVAYHNHLYLQAFGRTWTQNVARDPHVRIKVGNQLYDRTVAHVNDLAEFQGVAQSMAKKYYPRWSMPEQPELASEMKYFLRVND